MKRTDNLADLGKLMADRAPKTAPKDAEVAQSQRGGTRSREIRLQRTIEVSCWRVIGRVAKAQKRPELNAVLLRTRECGSTDADDIAGHLLFEPKSRRVVAQRLLQIAVSYGLLEKQDRGYVLTKSGEDALEKEQVLVPEHGTWTIWVSNDPLLTTPILRVEPWEEPTAFKEVRDQEHRRRPFEQLPKWVSDTVGVVAVPLVGVAPLRIDHLEAMGEAADPAATLRATWDVTGARLRVGGALDGAQVDTPIDAPAVGAEAVWMQLLEAERLWSQWDPTARALRVGFEKVTAGERESLVRAVAFRRPNIAGLGDFDAATVDGVALRARSADDASHWATWRLGARVSDYATSERFSAWTAEAVAPFSEFQPSTPTLQALADVARQEWSGRPTPSAWHLVAAEDWML